MEINGSLLKLIRFVLVGKGDEPCDELEGCQYNIREAVRLIDAALAISHGDEDRSFSSQPVAIRQEKEQKPPRVIDPEAAKMAWCAIDLLLRESGAHGMSPETVLRVGRVMAQLLIDHTKER